MKILYYSSSPTLKLSIQAGPGTHMREMIDAMTDLGHEVLPLIMGDEIISDNVNTHFATLNRKVIGILKKIIPLFIWRSLKDYKLMKFDKYAEKILEHRIVKFKPDLIYERASYLQLSGVFIAKKHKIRHFMEINAPFKEEVEQFENAKSLYIKKILNFEKEIIDFPAKVFVVSSGLKKYYQKNTNDGGKIIVTPNSISLRRLEVDFSLKRKLQNTFKLNEKTVIGFVGSMFAYHGVDILIKAFYKFQCNNSDTLLLIVGDGLIIPNLKQLVSDLKITEKVVFTGSVNHKDVFTYIDLMDITVLAKSNWYCSPMKIFEYGAMGKAVISANTPGVRDVMENNIDGLLINATEDDLYRSICSLIENKDLRNKMAVHFKTKIINNYTWTNTAKLVLTS